MLARAYISCDSNPLSITIRIPLMIYRSDNRAYIAHVLNQFQAPFKLHLGCGANRFEGWINIDSEVDVYHADLLWDLRQGLPFEDKSCELVHSEHVFEHFTAEDALNLMRECRRVLIPGGVMRVGMADLEPVQDREALYRRLFEAEFGYVRDAEWGSSVHPELHGLETHAETRLICEALP